MTFLGGIKNKPTDFSVGKHPRTWFHPQQLNFQGRSFESFGSISPAAPLESIGGVHKTTSTQDMASSVRGALCKQNLLWEVGGFRKKCFHFSPTWHGRRRFPTLSTISACLESLVGPMFTSGGSENCNVTAAMSLTNSCNNFHLNDLGIVFTWVQLICRSDLKGNNNCHKFSGHPMSSGKWHWTLDSFKPPSLSDMILWITESVTLGCFNWSRLSTNVRTWLFFHTLKKSIADIKFPAMNLPSLWNSKRLKKRKKNTQTHQIRCRSKDGMQHIQHSQGALRNDGKLCRWVYLATCSHHHHLGRAPPQGSEITS